MKLYKPDSKSIQTFCLSLAIISLTISIITALCILIFSKFSIGARFLYAGASVSGGVTAYFTFRYLQVILEYLDFQSSVQTETYNVLINHAEEQDESDKETGVKPVKQTTTKTPVNSESTKLCPECGMDVPVKDEHCPYCGALIVNKK